MGIGSVQAAVLRVCTATAPTCLLQLAEACVCSASQGGGAMELDILGSSAAIEWTVSSSTFSDCSAVAGTFTAVRTHE